MEKELKEREIITTEEDIDKNNPAYFENNENNENREFYVYEHIRLDNMTCFYVGKGKGERAYDLERNDHHDNISNRHGHAVLIIKDNLTEEEAFELERDTIEDYVFNLGYGIDIIGFNNKEDNEIGYLTNCTWGGEGVSGANKGKHHSEEYKQKLSELMKGKNKGKKFSEEHKKNLSESHKGKQAGKNNPFYGKHHSDESKRKISESNSGEKNYMYGRHHSDESKRKISESKKGIQFSEEHKLNLSKSRKGKKLSEETKRKMSKARSKKVICITTGKTFDSCKEAGIYYNVLRQYISNCCRRVCESAGKLPNGEPLKWKFL